MHADDGVRSMCAVCYAGKTDSLRIRQEVCRRRRWAAGARDPCMDREESRSRLGVRKLVSLRLQVPCAVEVLSECGACAVCPLWCEDTHKHGVCGLQVRKACASMLGCVAEQYLEWFAKAQPVFTAGRSVADATSNTC